MFRLMFGMEQGIPNAGPCQAADRSYGMHVIELQQLQQTSTNGLMVRPLLSEPESTCVHKAPGNGGLRSQVSEPSFHGCMVEVLCNGLRTVPATMLTPQRAEHKIFTVDSLYTSNAKTNSPTSP